MKFNGHIFMYAFAGIINSKSEFIVPRDLLLLLLDLEWYYYLLGYRTVVRTERVQRGWYKYLVATGREQSILIN
jgi:hypothetical protein